MGDQVHVHAENVLMQMICLGWAQGVQVLACECLAGNDGRWKASSRSRAFVEKFLQVPGGDSYCDRLTDGYQGMSKYRLPIRR